MTPTTEQLALTTIASIGDALTRDEAAAILGCSAADLDGMILAAVDGHGAREGAADYTCRADDVARGAAAPLVQTAPRRSRRGAVSPREREAQRLRVRERAAAYRAVGLCRCGAEPAPGCAACAACLAQNSASQRRTYQQRARGDLCTVCGRRALWTAAECRRCWREKRARQRKTATAGSAHRRSVNSGRDEPRSSPRERSNREQ